VTITGMQIVKQCQAPLTGTFFESPSSGIDFTIRLGFDLDSSIGYAQEVGINSVSGDFFKDHVVTLGPGETRTFNIIAQTVLHYCQFTFQMSVATPGGVVVEKIDDNGKPFELTGVVTSSAYQALYLGGVTSPTKSGKFVHVNPKTYKVIQ
jgi:hypothetical protein